jgi:hypothetical protein
MMDLLYFSPILNSRIRDPVPAGDAEANPEFLTISVPSVQY